MKRKQTAKTQKLTSASQGPFLDDNARASASPFDTSAHPQKTIPWVLDMHLLQADAHLRFQLKEGLIVGRTAGTNASHIDLTPHGAREQGVSRQHAIIIGRTRFLSIRDLQSTNGTYINDLRLMPSQDVPLEHGDVLRFGKLEAKVSFSMVPPNKLATPEDLEMVSLPPEPAHNEYILVLEADPDVMLVYRDVLEGQGYRVMSGKEVSTHSLSRNVPDVVVLDLHAQQRRGDGLGTIAAIRRRVKTAPLLVLADLTATRPQFPEQAQAAGATYVLPKPVRAGDLLNEVAAALQDNRPANV